MSAFMLILRWPTLHLFLTIITTVCTLRYFPFSRTYSLPFCSRRFCFFFIFFLTFKNHTYTRFFSSSLSRFLIQVFILIYASVNFALLLFALLHLILPVELYQSHFITLWSPFLFYSTFFSAISLSSFLFLFPPSNLHSNILSPSLPLILPRLYLSL